MPGSKRPRRLSILTILWSYVGREAGGGRKIHLLQQVIFAGRELWMKSLGAEPKATRSPLSLATNAKEDIPRARKEGKGRSKQREG